VFREELRKLGWTEGGNIEIDTRWASGDVVSMKRFAKEFVALQPDLIVTVSTPATAAMLQQTRTIPILFVLAQKNVARLDYPQMWKKTFCDDGHSRLTRRLVIYSIGCGRAHR
jgi:ABC-type uncharacterized transport system substrate-binding protein